MERLLRLIESGRSMHDLARALGRSESDLEKQAQFLGVHIPQHADPSDITTLPLTQVLPES